MSHATYPSVGSHDAKRSTIADVAAHAGVSITTVSQVLNGRRPVAKSTQARVRDSIEELGFRPNEVARSLRRQRSSTVAIIVPNIAHVAYPIMARGASDLLRPLGYNVALYDTDGSEDIEKSVLRTVADRITDGAILFGFTMTDSDAEILSAVNIPFVNGGLNSQSEGSWDAVISDQQGGITAATKHLISRFGTSVGYLGGNVGDGPADVREASFLEAANQNRVFPAPIVVRAPFTYQGGRDAMKQLLATGNVPRALVVGNDRIAIGAMDVALRHGFRIPDDIAFVGYDNEDSDQVVSPPLSSIEPQLHEQGRMCAQLLIDRMSGSYTSEPRRVLLPTALVLRDSSGG